MIFLLFFYLMGTAKYSVNPWGQLSLLNKKEFDGTAQIYGAYTSGCLTSAEALPLEGHGYKIVNPSRNRYYAHPQLAKLIKQWGQWAYDSKFGSVVIGDLSQPAGGPLLGAHKSHQIGLDADIRYHMLEPDQKIKDLNNWDSTDVVQCSTARPKSTKRSLLSSNDQEKKISQIKKIKSQQQKVIQYHFLPQKWPSTATALLEKIAQEKAVSRIFVSAGVKNHLCKTHSHYPQWLKKLRPEWGHTGHFHVRLDCPQSDSQCRSQPPILLDPTDTTGVGCAGNEFNSWFLEKEQQNLQSNCLPKTNIERIPYWQTVITSPQFPKACAALVKL